MFNEETCLLKENTCHSMNRYDEDSIKDKMKTRMKMSWSLSVFVSPNGINYKTKSLSRS
jgi:hypothetical protein